LRYKGLADTIDILAARRMFDARDGRPRCQRSATVERQASRATLEHLVVPVVVTAANLVDSLRHYTVVRMADVTSMAAVRQGRGDMGQANLEVDSTQQNRAEIGRQAAAGEIGTGAARGNGCKTELLRGKIHARQGVFVLINVA
jgi:hypothetical protein